MFLRSLKATVCWYLLFNTNFRAWKLIIGWKIYSNILFSSWRCFFLKQEKKRQFLPLLCLLTSSANLFIMYWFLKRRKKLWITCACTFILIALNVLVFVYDGLKQGLILFGKNKIIASWGNSSNSFHETWNQVDVDMFVKICVCGVDSKLNLKSKISQK